MWILHIFLSNWIIPQLNMNFTLITHLMLFTLDQMSEKIIYKDLSIYFLHKWPQIIANAPVGGNALFWFSRNLHKDNVPWRLYYRPHFAT